MPIGADDRILARIVKAIQTEEEDPLTPLIDEYLRKRKMPKYRDRLLKTHTIDVEERPRPGGRLSPSSLCGCERQAMLKFVGIEGTFRNDPDQELLFIDGHWRHHKWAFIFREMESILGRHRFQVVHVEHPIVIESLYVAGHLDIEIKIKVDGKWRRYVVDFKGANNFSFEKTYRDQAPDPTYVKQLITYMKGRKAKRGILLYDSKDKNTLNVFMISADKLIWGEVRNWCRKVLRQIEERKLPPMHPECENGNFLYNRCQYKGLCYGNKSNRQIQREVYVGFPGMEKKWAEGVAEVEAHSGD